MKAELNNYRQSPRKVRLVADLVRGQSVSEALSRLKFLPRRAARPVEKLIKQAAASEAARAATVEGLTVKKITVDKGVVLKRHRARARGRAAPIHKHTSHVSVTLEALSPRQTS